MAVSIRHFARFECLNESIDRLADTRKLIQKEGHRSRERLLKRPSRNNTRLHANGQRKPALYLFPLSLSLPIFSLPLSQLELEARALEKPIRNSASSTKRMLGANIYSEFDLMREKFNLLSLE